MALRTALVDQAFLQRPQKTVQRVGGRTLYRSGEDVEGPMIRARLQVTGTAEGRTDGQTTVNPRPTLMVGVKDSEGNPVAFKNTDKIRVISRELGEGLWEVDGDPEPLRKRRILLGWVLNLHRVEEEGV